MKKIISGLALAAAAMFSACENLALQESEGVDNARETASEVFLTATLDPETRTYLEEANGVYKTRWAEEDGFRFWNLNGSQEKFGYAEIVDGVGKSSATFAVTDGTFNPDNYLAVYGYSGSWETGEWGFSIERNQRMVPHKNGKAYGFDVNNFPMVAVGKGNELKFKNVCAVLKLKLTGNGERVQQIVIRSNDRDVYLSGSVVMSIEGERPTYYFGYPDYSFNDIVLDPGQDCVLSQDEPLECYAVIPAQEYPGGLSVTVVTGMSEMEVSTVGNLSFSQSELRELSFAYEFATEISWGLVGEYDWNEDGNTDWDGSDIPMSYEDGYWVLRGQYLEAGYSFKFRRNGNWDVNFGGVDNGRFDRVTAGVNQVTQLSDHGPDIYVDASDNYDIYLDVQNSRLYVMTPGKKPNQAEEPTPIPMSDGVYVVRKYNGAVSMVSDYREGRWDRYVVLEENEPFHIEKWEDGVKTVYGAGAYQSISYNSYDYYWSNLVEYQSDGMSVPESGLYFIAVDFNQDGALTAQQIAVCPVKWEVRGTCNGWESTEMEVEYMSSDQCRFVVRDLVFDSQDDPRFKFDYSDSWDITSLGIYGEEAFNLATNLGYHSDGHLGYGLQDIKVSPGIYDIYLEWKSVDGNVYYEYAYMTDCTSSVDVPEVDYSGCPLELVGTSVADGSADTSTWHWGNVLLADNDGYPVLRNNQYIWTWTLAYLFNDADATDRFDLSSGFKVRTVGWKSFGDISNFDIGYAAVDAVNSDPGVQSFGSNDDIVVVKSGYYDITCVIHPGNQTKTIKIVESTR